MITLTYTHKGWFGMCPIHIGDIEDDAPNGPCLKARHWSLEWLLDLSVALMDLAMACMASMGQEPPGYRIHIGPRLAKPIVEEVEP